MTAYLTARPGDMPRTALQRLKVAYLLQNAGNVDFRLNVGDTVPVRQTLRGLQRAGHEVTCFRLEGQSVLAYENVVDFERKVDVSQGLSELRAFRYAERGFRRVQSALRLPYFALFDSFRFYQTGLNVLGDFDLCHEHNGLFSFGTAMACRRLGLPYVLTVSADPFIEKRVVGNQLKGVHGAAAAWAARYTYRAARRIICVSEPARQSLASRWQIPLEKIAVMPNGVDLDLFRPDADPGPVRRRYALENRPVITFVGSFHPWHGLDRLVAAFAGVLKVFPEARLLLVGDGRSRQMVEEQLTRFGIDQQVIITGFVDQEEVPEMLAAADIAVLPYPELPEQLWFSPLKLYEYMAAGKAIVASASGQIVDVIADGHSGVLVPPGDVEQLAAALIALLNQPDRMHRLGNNARRQVESSHSWEQYIERLEAIYRDVLTSG
jgi:glycosyltransferase involved in cell wall biosynthesis